MDIELQADEQILRESRANMKRRAEQAAGRLRLTDRRLIFEPRGYNRDRESEAFPRTAITAVGGRWTKFFGFVPLAPNTLAVTLDTGRELSFIVPERDAWIAALTSPASAGSQL
jgi:hypothetical protein